MSEPNSNGNSIDDALSDWVKRAKSLPPLAADEEKELWRRIVGGDQEAYNRVVEGQLRLVITMALKLLQKQSPEDRRSLTPAERLHIAELIQVGHAAVGRAAQKFDPALGCRFSTHAAFWIRAAIRRAMSNQA